jgi:hypothetical protein
MRITCVGIVTQSSFLAEGQEALGQPSIQKWKHKGRGRRKNHHPSVDRQRERKMRHSTMLGTKSPWTHHSSARRARDEGEYKVDQHPCLIQSLTGAPEDCCIINEECSKRPSVARKRRARWLIFWAALNCWISSWLDTTPTGRVKTDTFACLGGLFVYFSVFVLATTGLPWSGTH